MWSVGDARILGEVLRRVRAGKPQLIGTRDGCVVLSAGIYREKIGHDGQWLIS